MGDQSLFIGKIFLILLRPWLVKLICKHSRQCRFQFIQIMVGDGVGDQNKGSNFNFYIHMREFLIKISFVISNMRASSDSIFFKSRDGG